MSSAPQLPLGVQLRDDATLDNFLFLPSLMPLKPLVEQLTLGRNEYPLIFLYGPPGSGRSHLLEAVCHAAEPGTVQYLPLQQLAGLPAADVLSDLELLKLVCFDDLEAIAGDQHWEEAMFHFYNRSQDSGCSLVYSAGAAPAQLDIGLADLRSRLSSGLVFQMSRAMDSEKGQILQFRASKRGFSLTDEVISFILSRAGRSLGELLEVLDRLDRESLVEQRQLTIPFVKRCMNW